MNRYTPIRVRIKNSLRNLLSPSFFRVVNNIWIRWGAPFFNVQSIVDRYTAEFLKQHPRIVQGGPFVGMLYVEQAVGSNYLHKLIGSYEAILHPFLRSIVQDPPKKIIDIGSAEGYYLVGLGRLLPDVSLVGFETENSGRDLTRQMYELNKLSNPLILEGSADARNIGQHLTGDELLICDCEGGEMDILDPAICPELKQVRYAVIELHDFIRPGIQNALRQRFAETHEIKLVRFEMADPEQFPFLSSIQNKKDRYELLRERGWQEQEWMILTRK